MYIAVLPARNESRRLVQVITNLLPLPLGLIVPVINGSSDTTLAEVLKLRSPRVEILFFPESLGLDVPRAVGAKYALVRGAKGVLFVDGDMVGSFQTELLQLLEALNRGCDLVLTNCYPASIVPRPLTAAMLFYRALLNHELGLDGEIGLATPSHGPHAISALFLQTVPLEYLATPPKALACARLKNLKIQLGASLDHARLGSSIRTIAHGINIVHTIIGDCLEALTLARGEKPSRTAAGQTFVGYDIYRRRDILKMVLENKRPFLVIRLKN
ncbi:MAG: hypothetical protein PWP65_74 [Clostridia bacterium]|nr:hypothetical protein [Clostridia bacterium]